MADDFPETVSVYIGKFVVRPTSVYRVQYDLHCESLNNKHLIYDML